MEIKTDTNINEMSILFIILHLTDTLA